VKTKTLLKGKGLGQEKRMFEILERGISWEHPLSLAAY
jgi:hypothetical protein